MNLNPIDLSRRKDLLIPKQLESEEIVLEKCNEQAVTSRNKQRAFSPMILFNSPARINHLLTLNQKGQFRTAKGIVQVSVKSVFMAFNVSSEMYIIAFFQLKKKFMKQV